MGGALFDRVVSILEQARGRVVESVNRNTLAAYWAIGREIVQEIQGGEERGEYGSQQLALLSKGLTKKYGAGYSVPNLQSFRKFYLAYRDRKIWYPAGTKSSSLAIPAGSSPIGYPVGSFSSPIVPDQIQAPDGTESSGFLPRLSWSHYRAIMRVKSPEARAFYETEASECGWDKRDLERQIHSQYYERILSSQDPQAIRQAGRAAISKQTEVIETLKQPYVLEFLSLPELPVLHESHLESAIMTQLQSFLLELGKGFAFVGRQKRLQFEDKSLYVDLVFYNCILKCYLLIDLKMSEITHQDVGQMDGYVRLFDDQYVTEGDNPTIGLILCAEKNEAVARYSVLADRKQIFASKYMLHLPTEEQLAAELLREKRLIENAQERPISVEAVGLDRSCLTANEPPSAERQNLSMVVLPKPVAPEDSPFGIRHGSEVHRLGAQEWTALQEGKTVALDVLDEYVVFVQKAVQP